MQKATWVRSSFSYANGNCVEVLTHTDGRVEVRNSRFPDKQMPPFTQAEWDAFVAGVRNGEFG